ncbi:hypothetical protein J3A72_003206 [Stenotrophomonas sp. PvP093]|uniref:Uncharacterized protein n=1 Tax=Stenotrophomonas pavanii TaxID=487698 RepID=A0A2D0ANY0_9GAMM|nr:MULTISPECIES: hypothetical protein [Stenotrophomonas]MBP2482914.1 hypothetical protein [Stenotrophomonas sp. PvP093]OWR35281.1 hypothetical protein CEE55_02425 [Stenotrophomonas pavanii]QDY49812.1 hypothetical protein DUW70_15350 [Stenotrophomonas maltophilia]
MSRSGYSDDCDSWPLICWRGAVASALRGRRGQQFLVELREALDAMPEKRLIAEQLQDNTGCHCALGVIGSKRGLDMTGLDPDDRAAVSKAFGIAEAMAAEIVHENDGEWRWDNETPEQRWTRMRAWVDQHITESEAA